MRLVSISIHTLDRVVLLCILQLMHLVHVLTMLQLTTLLVFGLVITEVMLLQSISSPTQELKT